MKIKLKLWTGWDSVRRLVRNFRVLGILNGWHYWRVENLCIKDPSAVIRWAENCEVAAALHWAKGEDDMAAICADWADKLREKHRIYIANVCGEVSLPVTGALLGKEEK